VNAVSPQQFRALNRHYGELVPPQEIEAHLAAGWELIVDSSFDAAIDGALMRAPCGNREAA
jgi:hypothetical protein